MSLGIEIRNKLKDNQPKKIDQSAEEDKETKGVEWEATKTNREEKGRSSVGKMTMLSIPEAR